MNRDLVDPKVSLTNCSGDGAVLLVLSTFVDISTEFFLDRVVGLFSTDSATKHQISQMTIQFSPITSALLHNNNSYKWAIVSHLSLNEHNSNFKKHFSDNELIPIIWCKNKPSFNYNITIMKREMAESCSIWPLPFVTTGEEGAERAGVGRMSCSWCGTRQMEDVRK